MVNDWNIEQYILHWIHIKHKLNLFIDLINSDIVIKFMTDKRIQYTHFNGIWEVPLNKYIPRYKCFMSSE